jgi:hypothetical protein
LSDPDLTFGMTVDKLVHVVRNKPNWLERQP